MKRIGPITRPAKERKYSICGSAELSELDWLNWWQDEGYIHVLHKDTKDGPTWHRVYPKRVHGRVMERVAAVNGEPQWLFDKPE